MTKINKTQIEDNFDLDSFNHDLDLEKIWHKSLPRFTDKQYLDIFPEFKIFIPEKIAEVEQQREGLIKRIRNRLLDVKNSKVDADTQWFQKEWLKICYGEKLLKTQSRVARLKRLLWLARGKDPPKGSVTKEQIDQALSVPIEHVIGQELKKSGERLFGLCPLHREKTPSFTVYPDNKFHCFGCGVNGDSITLIRKLHDFNFVEAVRWLNKA